MFKKNKPETKTIYVIARPDDWCWLNEIFYSRKQAVKYKKKIKDDYYISYNFYKQFKVKKIVLKASEGKNE